MTIAATRLGPGKKRIAIIGTGVAGLLVAERLSHQHEIVVYEADARIGGHTHTVDVDGADGKVAIDTGFIVCNDRSYPGFLALLQRLEVPLQPTTMSFSVRCERTGLEYNGGGFNKLFAQRSNLLRPRFWGMLRDILKFHDRAGAFLDTEASLRDVLHEGGFGRAFADNYLVPMMAAIWSAEPARLMLMPARFFVRFFENHGMLQVTGRPQWLTVQGGSRNYLAPLSAPFQDCIRLQAKVVRLHRALNSVYVQTSGDAPERFDAAIVATHSDQALSMLSDASDDGRQVLAAIPYHENEVVLHTDTNLLPRRKRAWAAWNYHLADHVTTRATVTYCMNILQGLNEATTYNITLNRSEAIDPSLVLRRFTYHHPVFDAAGVAAQQQVRDINGHNRVWFAGAWTGFGFHEDAVQSALRVARDFGCLAPMMLQPQPSGVA